LKIAKFVGTTPNPDFKVSLLFDVSELAKDTAILTMEGE